ncbi:MAG: EI24 domain-containing protein [Arcobacteraceae bacterium]|jgi:hypothetical protein|nr:EI24 domain-containing protein [Arcobacteraceae bacterium]MDY0364363.1 EI24 domain-containing protein [Arcobacteraceae bacterium]
MNKNLISQSIDDFFTSNIIRVTLYSLLITLFVSFGSLYLAFDGFSGIKEELLLFIDGNNWYFLEGLKDSVIVDFILKQAIFSFVLNLLFFLGFGLIIYYIFFILYSFIIGLFTPIVIKDIKNRYYTDVDLYGLSFGTFIWFYLKTIIITIVLFIVLIPFYFIPILNLLIFLPMYYFFHKTILFDILSSINTLQEYKKIKDNNYLNLKIKTFICFIIALIPVVGIILYPLYIIYLSHFVFQKTEELRSINSI